MILCISVLSVVISSFSFLILLIWFFFVSWWVWLMLCQFYLSFQRTSFWLCWFLLWSLVSFAFILSWVLDDVPPFSFVSLNILPRYFVSSHFFTNTFIDGSIQWLKVRKVLVLGQRCSGKWGIQKDANGLCQSLMCVISAFLPHETITFRDHGKENTFHVEPVVSEGC